MATQENCYIDNLPDELLLSIFKYLPPGSLLTSERVCVRWNQIITSDKDLWSNNTLTLKKGKTCRLHGRHLVLEALSDMRQRQLNKRYARRFSILCNIFMIFTFLTGMTGTCLFMIDDQCGEEQLMCSRGSIVGGALITFSVIVLFTSFAITPVSYWGYSRSSYKSSLAFIIGAGGLLLLSSYVLIMHNQANNLSLVFILLILFCILNLSLIFLKIFENHEWKNTSYYPIFSQMYYNVMNLMAWFYTCGILQLLMVDLAVRKFINLGIFPYAFFFCIPISVFTVVSLIRYYTCVRNWLDHSERQKRKTREYIQIVFLGLFLFEILSLLFFGVFYSWINENLPFSSIWIILLLMFTSGWFYLMIALINNLKKLKKYKYTKILCLV